MSTSRHSAGSATWVAWLPLLFVGAMLFWTIALGLGGLSLVTVTALSAPDDNGQVRLSVDYAPMPPMAIEPMPGNPGTSEGILVRLQESPEPQDGTQDGMQDGMEDGNDNSGAVPAAADVIEAGP
jgi:hypothetical protein